MENLDEVINSFKGFILSLKTKPGEDGISENIIGTLRHLDIDEGCVTLDEVMCNGEMLPDGFILKSSQIADLQVCGKAVGNEVMTLLEADFNTPVIAPILRSRDPSPKVEGQIKGKGQERKPTKVAALAPIPQSQNQSQEFKVFETRSGTNLNSNQIKKGGNTNTHATSSQFQSLANPFLTADGDGVENRNPLKNLHMPVPMPPMQVNIKVEPEELSVKSRSLEASLGIVSSPKVNTTKMVNAQTKLLTTAKPPTVFSQSESQSQQPRKIEPRVVYVASELEKNYFDKAKQLKAGKNQTFVAPFPPQGQKYSLQNTIPTCVLQKLVHNQNSSVQQKQENVNVGKTAKTASAAAAAVLEPDNPFAKLLRRPPQTQTAAAVEPQSEVKVKSKVNVDKAEAVIKVKAWPPHPSVVATLPTLPSSLPGGQGGRSLNQYGQNTGKGNNNSGNNGIAPGRQNGQNGNGKQPPKHESTFEMTNDEICAEEFDFEQSNAMFEKLPVDLKTPQKPQKEPTTLGPTDTTFMADRTVESIRLKDGLKSIKNFVSDTGVLIPAVEMRIRSRILNAAHEQGLTHTRMIEVMGRATAQTCIPFLGNSFRLSPEREDDRPSVLVCTGAHWQGAVGICAARILASQGCKTYVYAKKLEANLCAVEERLYLLTGQKLTREVIDLVAVKFDLVIFAKDCHSDHDLSLGPVYFKWMQNKPLVLVDPPALQSYRRCFEGEMYSDATCAPPSRITVVTPALPLGYGNDPNVKIFLVNMGIPRDIFAQHGVIYKSPFGDKLTIQIFSEKQIQTPVAAGGATCQQY